MQFFLEEILEKDAIRAYMAEDNPLADEGRKIAQQIAENGTKVKIDPGMLQVYVLAYLADYVLEKNTALGIPRQITVETLKDVNIWLENYRNQYGKPGLAQFSWLRHHYTGRMFCLGRLQFALTSAPAEVPGGAYALETHIPQGKPLTLEACLDSFDRAKEFFLKFFPDRPAEYFICHSWLLCPNLSEVLRPDSNIVRFMELWEKYPCASDHSAQAMERVFGFGFKPENLPNAPEETSLQKHMKAYLLAGGDLSACAGYRKI